MSILWHYLVKLWMALASLVLGGFLWKIVVSRNGRETRRTVHMAVFMGSGGHTAEMLSIIKAFDMTHFAQRTYILSIGDSLSHQKVEEFEAKQRHKGTHRVYVIPRARRVLQPWTTTPVTAAISFVGAFAPIIRNTSIPDLILCNGPGSCVMPCLVAWILRILQIKKIYIVYVESFARVYSLSLTGRIMLYLADRFFVQWPELASRYPQVESIGLLV